MKNTTHIIAPTGGQHTQTIIFLHGRDSNASEFAAELFESQSSNDLTLPALFPTTLWVPSSQPRTSARFEIPMSQWFDMWSVENHWEQSELQVEGLRESVREIVELVREEAELVKLERIVLGGISQGCATAVHALLGGGVRLGGFVGLCSWLPFERQIMTAMAVADNKATGMDAYRLFWRQTILGYSTSQDQAQDQAQAKTTSSLGSKSALETPVLFSHSRDDDVVPIANGEKLSETLGKLGMTVQWKEDEVGGHWINEPQGVDDIVSFIRTCLPVDDLRTGDGHMI